MDCNTLPLVITTSYLYDGALNFICMSMSMKGIPYRGEPVKLHLMKDEKILL